MRYLCSKCLAQSLPLGKKGPLLKDKTHRVNVRKTLGFFWLALCSIGSRKSEPFKDFGDAHKRGKRPLLRQNEGATTGERPAKSPTTLQGGDYESQIL
jgi:hypothetical protein